MHTFDVAKLLLAALKQAGFRASDIKSWVDADQDLGADPTKTEARVEAADGSTFRVTVKRVSPARA